VKQNSENILFLKRSYFHTFYAFTSTDMAFEDKAFCMKFYTNTKMVFNFVLIMDLNVNSKPNMLGICRTMAV